MSKLIIVESPSKIKTVKKTLGSDYIVMASKGHVRDLPKSKIGVDIANGFKPQYISMPDKRELIKELQMAASNAEKVYLATDPDREGEAISWHLANLLALDPNDENRVTFNEITDSGIKAGMSAPRKIDMNLVNAQQARRVLDRIVGYNLSPFLWKKVKSGLSAGRVQTVALRLIVDREKEISNFVPVEFWKIDAKLIASRKTFCATFYGDLKGNKIEIANEEQANDILSKLDNASYVVTNIKKGIRNRQPAAPFITATMQQEASRKLNFNGQKTMRVAQSLYEGVDIDNIGSTGLITYMRTDSLRISDEALKAGNSYILKKYGEKYLPKSPRIFKSGGNTQDAHEAIRPTNVNLTPDSIKGNLTSDQYKLYKLIWERFVASLMSNCVLNTVNVDITAGDFLFKANGHSVKFDGFTVLYEEGKDVENENTTELPEMSEGEVVKLKSLDSTQHFTQPPARFTEPTLIQALKDNGIGRPSTYAPIISVIQQRDYIEKEKKSFKPTSLGIIVSDLLVNHFKKIVDTKFTAGMENNLDQISTGELVWNEIIGSFYKDFESSLKKAESDLTGKKIKVPAVESDIVCDKCGRKMVVKSSRFGKFLACPGYPECKNTKPVPEDEVKTPCPKCGAKLVKRVSKKSGKKFYGCSNYPKCDFASPNVPTGDICPECGGFILLGLRGRKYCMNADCPTRNKTEKVSK